MGAGPSGLLLALRLARAGIQVTLVDAGCTVSDLPRASHYGPSAVRELDRAGVLHDIRAQGFVPGDMCWRRIDGSLIVKWNDSSQVNNPEAMTVLPLNALCKILLAHAEENPNFEVKWNHQVTHVSQDASSARVHARLPDNTEIDIRGDYICGCDGGNSQVRRTLFGDLNFPGKTWNAQIVATNVSLSLARNILCPGSLSTGLLSF